VFDFIASLIYPKYCVGCRAKNDYVCASCFAGIGFLEYQLCGKCQKGSVDGLVHPKCRTANGIDGIFSAISYRGIVKKLLYQFKYKPYLSDLKGILGKLLYEGIIQQEAFSKFLTYKNIVIISVPLHKKRERIRGYNQSELLAKEISKKLFLPYVSNILIRQKETKPQFTLDKKKRSENIKDAFVVNLKFKIFLKDKNILLIDDINTTGATLRECAKILKQNGAKRVLGITLAHEG
jgi:ComF family protein